MRADDGRASSRTWRTNRLLFTLATLVLLGTACSNSTTASSANPTVSIPSGWKTYTYGKVAIAVPSSWTVKHNTDCPNPAPAGALLLGASAEPPSCLPTQMPSSVVRVLSAEPSAKRVSTDEKPVTINGIPVYVGFGSPSMDELTVPSLDVQVTGTGPDSSEVMHTLHRA